MRDGKQESRLAWTYDEYGRTRTKSYDFGITPLAAPTSAPTIQWGYTPTGQLAFVKYPSGNQATYQYDANGHLQKIESGSTLIASFDKPDPSGRYLTADIANEVHITHRYESGRESSRGIETRDGVWQEAYSYDALGRLQGTERSTPSGTAQALSFSYDARNLLTREAVVSGDETQSYTYAHDQLGRRKAKETNSAAGDLLQTYVYDRGNRLLSVTGGNSSDTTWDPFGRPANDHRNLKFTWGLNDHLRVIQLPDGRREQMQFDADGQRIARTVDGKTDRFFSSDLSGEVYSQLKSDGSTLDVVRDPNGGVIALLTGDNKVIPWSAGKADTTLHAASKRPTAQSAFGEHESSDSGFELGFHQMWSSALTPLRFAGVRVYDDETGRFLTPDPLGVVAANDPNDAVDQFRYAHNNPLAVSDSTGYLGISPPTPTTIIVDGIAIETYDVNAWSVGTIRVANQAAYIAGVRAGIKFGLYKGWTLDQAVHYALGKGAPNTESADATSGSPGSNGAGNGGPRQIALGLAQAFANLFNKSSPAAGAPVADEGEVHADAADAAIDQAQGGGPGNGLVFNENGKVVRESSQVDPRSNPFWVEVDGPNGRETLGATSTEVIDNFFAANPEYTAAGEVKAAGDALEIEVYGSADNRHGAVRFGSGVMNGIGGAIKEAYNSLIHDTFGSMIAMGRGTLGYSSSFQPRSQFWNTSNTLMDNGYSYPGAIATVLSDGFFYGTIGAAENMYLGMRDGDWERVGENTFALGATVGGTAIGGLRAGMAAPTTRASLLGGLAPELSGEATMVMARRTRLPDGRVSHQAESVGSLVEECLSRPLLLRTPRAGSEVCSLATKQTWRRVGVERGCTIP